MGHKFALRSVGSNGKEYWLNPSGGWSLEESDRMLFDDAESCYELANRFTVPTTIEAIALNAPLIPSDFL